MAAPLRRGLPSAQHQLALLRGKRAPSLFPASSAATLRGFATSSSRWSPQETATTTLSEATGGFTMLQPYASMLTSISETLNCPQAVSIMLVAFTVRTVFTLPVTLWQRKRTQRMTELVVPEWTRYKEQAPLTVRARCRRAGKSFEEYKVELEKDLKSKINSLLARHSCSPLPTFLAPMAVHFPVFFFMSAVIRQACLDPVSPFSAEVLPWWSPSPEMAEQFKVSAAILADRGLEPEVIAKLQGTQGGPTLVDRDSTMIGPISLGMLTMTNVELTSWARRSLSAASESAQGQSQTAVEEGEPEQAESRRSRIITNALRVLAIGFIPIASQAPGALVIYWLSSGAYTLLQNTVFAVLDRRQEANRALSASRK